MPYLNWIRVPNQLDPNGYPYLEFSMRAWFMDEGQGSPTYGQYFVLGNHEHSLSCPWSTGVVAGYQGQGLTVSASKYPQVWANSYPFPSYLCSPTLSFVGTGYYSGYVITPGEIGGHCSGGLYNYLGGNQWEYAVITNLGIVVGVNSNAMNVFYQPVTSGGYVYNVVGQSNPPAL